MPGLRFRQGEIFKVAELGVSQSLQRKPLGFRGLGFRDSVEDVVASKTPLMFPYPLILGPK